jgi:hypothetical protein
MIQPNELRIGNFISICDDPNRYNDSHEVTGISKENGIEIHNGEVNVSIYNGIPLTEEWLLKFGFEVCKNGIQLPTFEGYVFINYLFSKGQVSEGQPLTLEIDGRRMPLFSVLSVHQLQNLYFALTGQELTIRENIV